MGFGMRKGKKGMKCLFLESACRREREREDEEDFKNWKVLNGKSPIMRRVPDYYNRRVNGSEKATFR